VSRQRSLGAPTRHPNTQTVETNTHIAHTARPHTQSVSHAVGEAVCKREPNMTTRSAIVCLPDEASAPQLPPPAPLGRSRLKIRSGQGCSRLAQSDPPLPRSLVLTAVLVPRQGWCRWPHRSAVPIAPVPRTTTRKALRARTSDSRRQRKQLRSTLLRRSCPSRRTATSVRSPQAQAGSRSTAPWRQHWAATT
jgi:hypothetical protein